MEPEWTYSLPLVIDSRIDRCIEAGTARLMAA
jgi:hypothetical protein